MKVEIDGQIHLFERGMPAFRLLEKLALSPESHLVVVNGKLVTGDQRVEVRDSVKIVRVISGG
mgnify:CR=1 FL=1